MKRLFYILLLLSIVGCSVRKHQLNTNDLSNSSIYDFGITKKAESLQATFVLKNTFDNPINLYKVATSCKCVKAELNKTKLKPDESTKVNVTFNTEGLKGLQKKVITIETDNPHNKYLQFYIKTEIID